MYVQHKLHNIFVPHLFKSNLACLSILFCVVSQYVWLCGFISPKLLCEFIYFDFYRRSAQIQTPKYYCAIFGLNRYYILIIGQRLRKCILVSFYIWINISGIFVFNLNPPPFFFLYNWTIPSFKKRNVGWESPRKHGIASAYYYIIMWTHWITVKQCWVWSVLDGWL